jgi:P-type Ca2+ transporter type 2C
MGATHRNDGADPDRGGGGGRVPGRHQKHHCHPVHRGAYALLGFSQEYRAEQAISALKKMSVPHVRALRNAKLQDLSARDLVPGDIIQLETGNVIPADLRLIEAVNLRIQEAALTGESDAIEKHTAALSNEELPLGDRRNMAYMGTIITKGRGLALVTATGMKPNSARSPT